MKQILIILIVLIRGSLSQSNPCPDVFQFKSDGITNYGIITIPPPGRGVTILEIEIGIRGSHNGNPTSLDLVKSLEDAVRDAGRGRDIQYRYDFPQSTKLPTIRRITLNNRDICNGPIERVSTFWNKHTIRNPEDATQLSRIPSRKPSAPVSNPQPVDLPNYPDFPWIIDFPPATFAPAPPPTRPPPTRPPPTPRTPTPTTPSTRPPPTREPIRTPAPPAEISRQSDNSWVGELPSAGTCGRKLDPNNAFQATNLIIGGVDVAQGEFPWLVALFHYKGRKVEAVCGASLVSNSFVVTAAHCTRNQKRVYLELGKHDISDPFESDYIARNSMEIIEHPDYVSGAHGDIALVRIEPVTFTLKIKPICLWTQGTRFDNILKNGTVTGWGRIQNDGDSSKTPMKLNVRTVGLDVCRKADENLRKIATDKTFCAGGTGTGPCHGDSGSGFYMKHADVWYLRGVISTSLGTSVACNVERYAVYVDLTYFLDWMRPYLLS